MTTSSDKKPLDIHDIIAAYSARADSQTADVLQKLSDEIRAQQKPSKFKIKTLSAPGGAAILEMIFTDLVRAWPSRGKNKAAQALLDFAYYLRTDFGIILDESLLPRNIPNVTERRLDMLKYLQIPRTMGDLETRYLTSERTLRGDLNALVDGWELLGNKIKIRRKDQDGKISYNSTVHPVLLPLNLTEVYALVAGYPRLAKGTVYEEIAPYLAKAVGAQLSDYAAEIIERSAPDLSMRLLDDDGKSYRPENTMLQNCRISWLIYLTKQGLNCRVSYVDHDGQILHVEGVPSLGHDDLSLIKFREQQVEIPLCDIISIEPLEAYL